jgi:hypothetical protein
VPSVRFASRSPQPAPAIRSAKLAVLSRGKSADVAFTSFANLEDTALARTIHEDPSVPNFPDPFNHVRLTEGMVLTIEPIIAAGTNRVRLDEDKWALRTDDGSLAAHYEHTLVIIRGDPILLTAA